MGSLAVRFAKFLRPSNSITPTSSLVISVQRSSKSWCSTVPFNTDNDDGKKDDVKEDFDDFLGEKVEELQPQGVDPRRGWGFRGVHKCFYTGNFMWKSRASPYAEELEKWPNGNYLYGWNRGMFDQRIVGAKDLPKPAQWHRIAVHNDALGTYAVQQLVKNSSVYVEGDIETRVYNDAINGEVKNIPEICVRRDGKIRLIRAGESLSSISFEELREGLF